ncbi:MAG: glycosyltransferase [Pirellulales bacterium]
MSRPRISVLMPVYNAERYVAQAVESILTQSYPNFELIIIDDGSTDSSPAILNHAAGRDSRIRLTSRPNTGYVRALNEALAIAQGELVARMDADDVALPERFARQVEYLERHPDCLALGSAFELIDPDGAVLARESPPAGQQEIEARLLRGLGGLCHPTAMIRREPMAELGGYRQECYGAEDKDLWLRLGERGGLANLGDVLLQCRVHEENFTFTHYEQGMGALRRAVTDAHRRRGLVCPAEPLAEVPLPVTASERRRQWAWSAIQSGNYSAARKHAWAAWRGSAGARESWVLLAYALLGTRADALRAAYRRLRGQPP